MAMNRLARDFVRGGRHRRLQFVQGVNYTARCCVRAFPKSPPGVSELGYVAGQTASPLSPKLHTGWMGGGTTRRRDDELGCARPRPGAMGAGHG